MRRLCLLLLAGCMLLGLVAAAAAGERAGGLLRLRLRDPRAPMFYVRYEDWKLWVAPSFAALKTAKPLRQVRSYTWYDTHDRYYGRDRQYAEMKLSGPIGRFTEVRMQPLVTVGLTKADDPGSPAEGEFAPEFRFLYRDKSRATWDHRTVATARFSLASSPMDTELLEVDVPDPAKLGLALQTEAGQGKIGLSIEGTLGPELLVGVQRNGKAFPVRVTITDARGKVIHSVARDIWGFRYSRFAEGCYARVPKGRYTVTAAIGRTPFCGAVSASSSVVVN